MYARGINMHPKLSKQEQEDLLHASEVGDGPTVRRFMSRFDDLDLTFTDILGRTPLRLAVENEHEEVVELLLDKTDVRHLYEALLLSISLDHDDVAGVILTHPMYEKLEERTCMSNSDHLFTLLPEDSQFSTETTPLILASQRNRFEIVSFLIRKGQRIEKPHMNQCNCPLCATQVALDELRHVKSRLNSYKGLASDSYISLSSEDPILTAFNLRQELRQVAQVEKHYKFEYETLARKLSDYVVHLLDHVRGNDELDIILNEHQGAAQDSTFKMARLKLAIRYNEKPFVTHPSCTKKLTSKFYGDQKFFQHLPLLLQMLFTLALTPVYPFLAVIYWIAPNSKVGHFLRTPVIQFLGQTISFLVFLTLIVTFWLSDRPSDGSVDNAERVLHIPDFKPNFMEFEHNLTGIYRYLGKLQVRDFYPGPTQILICVWIIGMLWQEIKQLYEAGPREYFRSVFNIIDFFSIQLYIISFTLRYVSVVKTTFALKYFCKRDSWEKLSVNSTQATYNAYWLIADRYFWDPYDPMYICEGIFAMANVLSFSRLMYLLAASAQLGPLQVSIRRMMVDIGKFMVIFLIVFAAFLVGLNNLYWHYRPVQHENIPLFSKSGPTNETKPLTFSEWLSKVDNIFRTMFWALFGMGDADVVEKGMSFSAANMDLPDDDTNSALTFTERVGYIIYGGYNCAAVIVLLNMLIAMMSRSYNKIQNDAHMEWKFARARMYMDYIAEGSTLPPPLNIVPSPKSVFRILFPCMKCCPRTEKHFDTTEEEDSRFYKKSYISQESPHGIQHQVSGHEDLPEGIVHMQDKRTLTYQDVIKSVLKRYIFGFQQDNAPAPEAEIEEIKQDLSSLRYEVFSAINHQNETLLHAICSLSAKLDISHRLSQNMYPDVFDDMRSSGRGSDGYGIPVVEDIIIPKTAASSMGASHPRTGKELKRSHSKVRRRKCRPKRRFSRKSLTFVWEI